MQEPIIHEREAKKALHAAQNLMDVGMERHANAITMGLAAAQVHATLALVERVEEIGKQISIFPTPV